MGITLTGKKLEYTPLSSGYIYAASDSFFNFTLSNLTAVPIGELDGALIQGLTVRPADSVLFGISTSIHGSQLYKIDPVIGGCKKVVDLTVAEMRAIAFAPSGTLFAGTKNGSLYKINTVTGEASVVGTPSGKVYSSFSFSPDGKLYSSVSPTIGTSKDAIYTIDTTSGVATLLGNTGDGKATPSIAFNADGKLYGLKGTQIVVNTLIEISTANGLGTELGSLGISGLHAIIMSDNTTGINDNTPEKLSYALHQNYPNPFNPVTTINYTLSERSMVRLSIINILGEEISLLLNEEQNSGNHQVKFDGSGLSTGVYFYQLKAGEFKQTKKMILIK